MNALRVMWLFFRVGIMSELQYRVNFFLQLLQSLITLGTGLVALYLVFSYTTSLNGWREPELLAVLGVFTLMGGFIRAFIQPNMERIMNEVQQGTLDFALTKPEDSQVIASVREVRIWQTVDVILGLIVLAYAIGLLQVEFGLTQALSFVAALLFGGITVYSFWLILTTTAFWVIAVHDMINLFQGVFQAGRFPVDIYPGWLQTSLTFLVPVAFAVTVPAQALTNRLSVTTLLGAALLALAMFTAARLFWKRGLRQYSGASA